MSQIWLEINQESRIFFRILLCSGNLQELSALHVATSDLFSTKCGNFSTFFSKTPLIHFAPDFFFACHGKKICQAKKKNNAQVPLQKERTFRKGKKGMSTSILDFAGLHPTVETPMLLH
jgi:hypothetical protein